MLVLGFAAVVQGLKIQQTVKVKCLRRGLGEQRFVLLKTGSEGFCRLLWCWKFIEQS
jgi:hypothetical protein